jgi:ABC-type glycerol-3-phosphate transport system substrate-binding protein
MKLGRMRRSTLVAVWAATAMAAAGCGAAGSRTPLPSGPDLRGQSLEVAATWTGAEQQNFEAVLQAFHIRTGATVRYTSGGNDLAVLLNSRLAGGSPPDVAFIPQPGVVAELVRQGAVYALTGEALAAVRANYSPAWQRLGQFNGRQYGVYFKVANKSVIWYRTDDFADAGVQPPKTWDEFVSVSKTLRDAGDTPMVAAGGDGWVLTDWFENAYLRLGGPDNYDRLARHGIPWTDPTVVATLDLLRSYWTAPRFVEDGPQGAVGISFTQGVADVFGAAPKASMMFEGDFVAAEIAKLGRTIVGQGARFFEWPSMNGSPPAVIAAGDQAVAMRDTPAAMALMAFLASPEAARIQTARGGFLSANAALTSADYRDPTTRALAESVVSAELLRFDLSDQAPLSFGGSSTAHMWVLLQEFLRNSGDSSTVARELEEAAVKDYGGTR